MLIDTNKANEIYNSLADDLSKSVFLKRLAYSIVECGETVRDLARFDSPEFIDKVRSFTERGDRVAIYGVGKSPWHPGKIFCSLFYDLLAGVFDKNADNIYEIVFGTSLKETRRIKVEKPEKIRELGQNVVIIVATQNPEYQAEMYKNLLSFGVPAYKIIFCPPLYLIFGADYFIHPFLEYGKDEVFVDCGCYDGRTSIKFIETMRERERERETGEKIFAFEPDAENYLACKENLSHIPFAVVRNLGVWNKKETLRFSAGGEGGSISETGNVIVDCIALDDELADEKVTFIKMDIEGAELNALKGAEKLIRRCRPKLAICLYHKPEDILTIPDFIIGLGLDYKIYIRHQSISYFETILYAIPN